MKYFVINIVILILFTGISFAQSSDSAKYQDLDPYYFHLQYLKEEPAILLDVRQFFEFRGRRIKDAVNAPSSKHLYVIVDTMDRKGAFFLYCTDGFRSRQAAELLYDRGFRNIYNLRGGMIAWKREGFPVERGKVKRLKK